MDQAILDRSFLAAADHAEPLLRGVLLFQDDQPAGYIYLTQCYSAEVGAGACSSRRSSYWNPTGVWV